MDPRQPKPLARVSRREVAVVLAVAGLALVLGVASIAVSLTALGWAAGARSDVQVASQLGIQPLPVPPILSPTPGGGAGAQSPSPSSPSPSPSPTFAVAYTGALLRIHPSCSGDGRPVDVDQPRVGVADDADFAYHGCGGAGLSLNFAVGVEATSVRSARAGAQDCADAIRVGAVPGEIEPSAGQSLCVLTAGSDGAEQRYVLLHIDSVDADGAIDATASAWTVPS